MFKKHFLLLPNKKITCSWVFLWKPWYILFSIIWWRESWTEQHLFEIEIFCNQFTETSSDARPWTHHQCCLQESVTGCFGSYNRHPRPGIHLVLHRFFRQSSTRSWYFSLFLAWASSILSSQGTVSSIKISCFVASETKMMSGLNLDWVMCVGIFSCLSRSTVIAQSRAVVVCKTYRAVFRCFLWLLSFPDEVDGLGCSLGVPAVLDPLVDCLSNRFEDLVVPPSIPALTQRLGAAAQDVF